MGYFYGYRILNQITNPKTGQAWKIEDVPAKWVADTEKWLEEHKTTTE